MTDWAIPQQAKLKYTQLFNIHDRARTGFLSGLQCRDILLQSGLPRNTLAEIWNLSDIDGDGQLTREEFILAMYLTNQVRSGQKLPQELPSELVPPSYRRTRSISTNSIHSTTSAGSSISGIADEQALKPLDAGSGGSILNSHSFEDKRRENFERGRAELERRRLMIIDQQTSVLREQLTVSKKQVAEAKAEIDSMRSDRDSKMRLITSLEAQLLAVNDRKLCLAQEEVSLVALAKELNVITQDQNNLNHVSTAAKQELITMRDKLQELEKTRISKIDELNSINSSEEQMKRDLGDIVIKVKDRYEFYKSKVVEATQARTNIAEESKLQNPNLDSIWDAAPSFTPLPYTNPPKPTSEPIEPPPASTTSNDPWGAIPDQSSTFITNSIHGEQDLFAKSIPGFEGDKSASINTSKKAVETGIPPKKYRVLYAFEARNPDELTINPGDIVIGSDVVTEPGWLSGNCNGQNGLFPESYVEPLTTEMTQTTFNNNYFESDDPLISSAPSNDSNSAAKNLASSSVEPQTIRYKVIYPFEARNPDELSINIGDIVNSVEGAHEPGWLLGEMNGQKGLFPESYVEKLAGSTPKVRSKKAEVATVIANYKALGQEQLNLEKGQLVLVKRKMESGWWEGEIQLKGKKKQFGWFPASYVKLLSNKGASGGAD